VLHFGGECPQNPCLHTKWEFIVDVFQHMINGDEISDFVYLSFPKCYHITYSFKLSTHDQQIYIYICWQHPILGGVRNSEMS
jgi:hypothetical protein